MQLLLSLLALPLSALARPNPFVTTRTNCGDVRSFYDPTPEKWVAANTDDWLNNWWTLHQAEVDSMGFSKAFTRATLDMGLTCLLSGDDTNCIGEEASCNNRKFATLSETDMEPAYYVLTALGRFHGYINGYQQTIETAAVVDSFEQNYMTNLFYQDPATIDPTWLKEMINWLVAILSIGAAGMGIAAGAGPIASGVIGAGTTLVGGAQTEAFLRLTTKAPDVFGATANTGHAMSKALKQTFISLFGLNDKLMNGEEIKEGDSNSGDLRQFLKGGRWVNAPEMNKVAGLDTMTGVLQSIQINTLWRQQPIFIMGGLPCDSYELGPTPWGQGGEVGWCDPNENKAWFLYYYQTQGPKVFLSRPWGSDRLGENSYLEYLYGDASEFPGISVPAVVRSSVTSWKVAGNDYKFETFVGRMTDIMRAGHAPLSEESSLEGLWTIPVCDVSGNLGSESSFKDKILLQYGDTAPSWCADVCGDHDKTKAFFEAARLSDRGKFNYDMFCDSNEY